MQINVNLERTAQDLLTEFGAGAKIYVESSATQGGAYSLVTLATPAAANIVAGTERYELVDVSGTPGVTWYRTRVGNSGGTLFTDYSTPWLSTSLRAYASLDAFKRVVKTVSDQNDNALEGDLVDASGWLDSKCGRQFYRSPQVTGTETRTFRVKFRGERSLVRAIGHGIDIISITSIEIALGTGASYSTLAASEWFLLDPEYDGFPSPDVILSDVGSTGSWPYGYAVIRITGVFGFPSIPAMISRACIEVAREMHRQGPGGATAGQAGVNQYGTPIFMTGYPPSVRDVVSVGSRFVMASYTSV